MPITFLNRMRGGGTRAFDPDALSWRDAVVANGSSVSLARLIIVDQFIYGEKASGAWALTDDYWVFWAENAAQALTSLKQRRLATAVNSPAFTADRGYQFDAATNYVDTGFVPATHGVALTGDNQRLGVYERANLDQSANAAGSSSAALRRMSLNPRTGSTLQATLNNSGTSIAFALSPADSRGLKAVSRAGGLTVKAYDRGVPILPDLTMSSVGTSLPSYSLYIGCIQSAGTPTSFRGASIGLVVTGAPLSDAQELAQYNAVQVWASSVGAQV